MASSHPVEYELVANSPGRSSKGTDYDVIACFPWIFEDHKSLSWPGLVWNTNTLVQWRRCVKQWLGCVAICGRNQAEHIIRLIRVYPNRPLEYLREIQIEDEIDGAKEQFRAICWTLSSDLQPWLVLAGTRAIIYVVDPKTNRLVTAMKGHGGRITSLNYNPRNPRILCSTSRDQTTRLWSLDLLQSMKMASADPQLASFGPPFGAPLTGGEEESLGPTGRCFTVTAGGQTAGHQATVLDACFHPDLDVIVTSSVDHRILIWEYDPPPSPSDLVGTLAVLGRPLFCFQMIHHAQVIRVRWLSPSVLISQSPQSVTDKDASFPGKISVWKWLGYGRYREAVTNKETYAVDWENATSSRSYKILSEIQLRQPAKKIMIHGSLVALATQTLIRVLDVSLLRPRSRPEPDIILTRDLMDTDVMWEETLRRHKDVLWEQAERFDYSGVVGTASTEEFSAENIFAVSIYHGVVIRVGEGENMRIWATPKHSI